MGEPFSISNRPFSRFIGLMKGPLHPGGVVIVQ
jgi:hypothetical protein